MDGRDQQDGQQPREAPGTTAEPVRSRSLFAQARVVGLLTLLSRVLGLVRDAAMAGRFGNGVIMDAFTVAFRVPNLARQLFGEGALSTAFLPVFIQDLQQSGRDTAFRTASAVLLVTAAGLLGLVVALEAVLLTVHWCVPLGPEADLLLGLLAVLAPYLLLVCVLAQVCAVLHGLGRFGVPALLPVFLNAAWIAAIAYVGWRFVDPVEQIYQVAVAILAIGLIQIVLCVPVLGRLGFRFQWDWSASRDRVRTVFATMAPVLLGLSITQLNGLCDSLIAWGLTAPSDPAQPGWLTSYPVEEGTAAALYLGQRLYQFPLGVFAAAVGTVLFPLLTTHAACGAWDRFGDDLARGLRMVVAIGLPASAGLAVLALPVTRVLFERGEFDARDTAQTSAMIFLYGLGVWAASGLLILNRAYYALGDRITPLRVGLATAGLNLILNLALVWPLGGPGLALGTTLTVTVQCLTLSMKLARKLPGAGWRRVLDAVLRAVPATGLMMVVCVSVGLSLAEQSATPAGLLAQVAAGAATYFVAAAAFGLKEPAELFRRRQRENHG